MAVAGARWPCVAEIDERVAEFSRASRISKTIVHQYEPLREGAQFRLPTSTAAVGCAQFATTSNQDAARQEQLAVEENARLKQDNEDAKRKVCLLFYSMLGHS